MPLDATEIAVAGTGHIYTALTTATLPTDATTAPGSTDWTDIGYTTDAGVTVAIDRTTTDLMAWQSAEPVRVLTTARTITITFELEQFNPTNVQLALAGGDVTSTTGSGSYTFAGVADADLHAMVIDAVDGDATYRWIFPTVQVQGNVAVQLQRGGSMDLPLEFRVLAGAVEPSVISTAASWAA
jgi:hypothetical protein